LEISIIMPVLIVEVLLCWRIRLLYGWARLERGVGAARGTMLEAMYALPMHEYRSWR
jgi:hypothetical protein